MESLFVVCFSSSSFSSSSHWNDESHKWILWKFAVLNLHRHRPMLKILNFLSLSRIYLNARAHTHIAQHRRKFCLLFSHAHEKLWCNANNVRQMYVRMSIHRQRKFVKPHSVNRFLIVVYVHSDKRKHVQLSGAQRCQKSAIECNCAYMYMRCIKQLTVQSNHQTFKSNPFGKLFEIKVN